MDNGCWHCVSQIHARLLIRHLWQIWTHVRSRALRTKVHADAPFYPPLFAHFRDCWNSVCPGHGGCGVYQHCIRGWFAKSVRKSCEFPAACVAPFEHGCFHRDCCSACPAAILASCHNFRCGGASVGLFSRLCTDVSRSRLFRPALLFQYHLGVSCHRCCLILKAHRHCLRCCNLAPNVKVKCGFVFLAGRRKYGEPIILPSCSETFYDGVFESNSCSGIQFENVSHLFFNTGMYHGLSYFNNIGVEWAFPCLILALALPFRFYIWTLSLPLATLICAGVLLFTTHSIINVDGQLLPLNPSAAACSPDWTPAILQTFFQVNALCVRHLACTTTLWLLDKSLMQSSG